MTYVVVSRRVGIPGQPYSPANDADAQRLLAGGFIALAQLSPKKPAKARKVKTATKKDKQQHGN